MPLDTYDEEGGYTGHDAPVAVFVGPPPQIGMTRSVGWHKKRWMLLPPNSSWVPTDMLEFVSKHATGLVAPSKWAEGVLLAHCSQCELEVSVWRHGVAPEFTRDNAAHEQRRDEYGRGRFRVLHMASTPRERKGTAELISGWAAAVRRGVLGSEPILRIMVEDFSGKYEAGRKGSSGGQVGGAFDQWLPPRRATASCNARFFEQLIWSCSHRLEQKRESAGRGRAECRSSPQCTATATTFTKAPGVIVVPCGRMVRSMTGPALAPTVNARCGVCARGRVWTLAS